MSSYFDGLCHVHTKLSNHKGHRESDLSPERIAKAFKAAGVRPGYIAFAEHPSDPGRPAQLPDDCERLAELASHQYHVKGLPKALRGLEVSILATGKLEISDEALKPYDYIIASRHRLPRRVEKSRAMITQHFMAAAAHPQVDVIGHPNRYLMDKKNIPWKRIFDEAALHNTAIEVNVNIFPYGRRPWQWWRSRRQQQPWSKWLELLALSGAPIFIGSDIHTRDQLRGWLRDLESGLIKANRLNRLATMMDDAGIDPKRVVTRDYKTFTNWLSQRHHG